MLTVTITTGRRKPRQEEFLNYIFTNFNDRQKAEIKDCFINLSSFSRK